MGGRISAATYAEARRQLELSRHAVRQVFTDVDLIVTPTTPDLPETIEASRAPQQRRGPPLSARNTTPFNIYGLPTISSLLRLQPLRAADRAADQRAAVRRSGRAGPGPRVPKPHRLAPAGARRPGSIMRTCRVTGRRTSAMAFAGSGLAVSLLMLVAGGSGAAQPAQPSPDTDRQREPVAARRLRQHARSARRTSTGSPPKGCSSPAPSPPAACARRRGPRCSRGSFRRAPACTTGCR